MTQLLLSAPHWCFFKEEYKIETFYNDLRDAGYTAAEMVPPQHRKYALAAGLKQLNISGPGMTAGLNQLDLHGSILPEIHKAIDEAHDNQIPHVIIFSGNKTENSGGIDACSKALDTLLPYAEKKGITLVFEMLNSEDHNGYEADHSRYGFGLARRFDSPHLKVLLDLYHMHRMGEDPTRLIGDNIHHIAHLHVAGSPMRNFPAPEQSINYCECLQEAVKAGYRGYWGMEFIPQGNAIAELKDAAELFHGYADKLEVSNEP